MGYVDPQIDATKPVIRSSGAPDRYRLAMGGSRLYYGLGNYRLAGRRDSSLWPDTRIHLSVFDRDSGDDLWSTVFVPFATLAAGLVVCSCGIPLAYSFCHSRSGLDRT